MENKLYEQRTIKCMRQNILVTHQTAGYKVKSYLFQKRKTSIASNYREITLSSSASKICNKMLLNRIRPVLDEKLRTNQNGFRPGRSILAQILTLRRIIEGVKSKTLSAVMIFVDFHKAFDSIHRGKLMEILRAYGIPLETANAISLLFKNTTAKVISPDGDTSFFPIHAGVLQGDTLASYLFIIALDYAMRTAISNPDDCGFTLEKAKSRRHPALCVTDIDYADDNALLSDSVDKAEKLLHTVEMAAKLIGLYINEKKTQYMTLNQNPSKLTTINKKCIKPTNDFLYLGSWIYSNEKDVNVRIGKAWVSLQKLNTIWNSNLPKNLKLAFFHTTVSSVLFYGSSSWTSTKKLETKLNGCYTKMLRVVNNVKWQQRISNNVLYNNLPKITNTIATQRVSFVVKKLYTN